MINNNIVHYSNQYAIYYGDDRWSKLTTREFEVGLGLTIMMEIFKLFLVD
jgi:hypothetical protein